MQVGPQQLDEATGPRFLAENGRPHLGPAELRHPLWQREAGDRLVGAMVREGVRGGLEPHHQRGRLARHLGDEPRAAPVGGHPTVDPLAPQLRREVGLQHLVRHGHAGPQRDLRHPGELVVEVAHVARHREDPVPRLAERLADSHQLVGRRGGAGGELTVLGPVQDGARGRRADGAGVHRLAHDRGHLGDLLGARNVVGTALTQDEGPQRAVRDEAGHVEHPVGPFHLVEVLPEGLPVPVHALGQRGAGDVLHALHELNQPFPVRVPGRCEADAAIAHHDGGHPVPPRRRDLGVPGGLAVVVGVDVDPARRDQPALGVDLAAGGALDLAGRGDDAAVDGDVTGPDGPARSVGDGAAPDDQVVHGCSSVDYTQLRSFSIMATGSAPTGFTLRWVTPSEAGAATRSLM